MAQVGDQAHVGAVPAVRRDLRIDCRSVAEDVEIVYQIVLLRLGRECSFGLGCVAEHQDRSVERVHGSAGDVLVRLTGLHEIEVAGPWPRIGLDRRHCAAAAVVVVVVAVGSLADSRAEGRIGRGLAQLLAEMLGCEGDTV